jgi:hypothetical protein
MDFNRDPCAYVKIDTTNTRQHDVQMQNTQHLHGPTRLVL